MKKILLISHNFWPEPTGIGKYNGEMISWLSNHGYECTVLTTYPYYPQWKVQEPYRNGRYQQEILTLNEGALPVTVLRCPSYVPKVPSGKKRILQDLSFWVSKTPVILKLLFQKAEFDLIITIAPPFHLAYLGLLLKTKKTKLLYHIQDLQIEAAQELQILSNPKLFERLYRIEKDILKKADFVSTISEGMQERVQAKTDKKVQMFPNWADTNFFFPIQDREQLKTKWGYQTDQTVFLYSGAIGEKQGLENILYAAQELSARPDIQFLICGSGPYKEKLLSSSEAMGLKNLKFLPVQDKEVFNEFLNMGDYHLVLQKANAGDLVMPSKLTTILAIGGVSIVTAAKGTSLYNVVNKYDVGYIIEPEDPISLTNLISRVTANTDSRAEKCLNARSFALEFLNIDKVMDTFAKDFIHAQTTE